MFFGLPCRTANATTEVLTMPPKGLLRQSWVINPAFSRRITSASKRKSDDVRFKAFQHGAGLRAGTLIGFFKDDILPGLFLPLFLEDGNQFPVGFARGGVGGKNQFNFAAIYG
jgi:hypothetical protein